MKNPFDIEQFDLFKPPPGSSIKNRVSAPFHVSKKLSTGTATKDRLTIYTDGGCEPNPGAGGWCAIILRHGQKLAVLSGYESQTTNNEMELRAIVEGMRYLPLGSGVDLFSDSQYCVKGATSWMFKWAANDWRLGKRGKGAPVKNCDLWREIYDLKKKLLIKFWWVRGHNGSHWNEECDRIAGIARLSCGKDQSSKSQSASADDSSA